MQMSQQIQTLTTSVEELVKQNLELRQHIYQDQENIMHHLVDVTRMTMMTSIASRTVIWRKVLNKQDNPTRTMLNY